MNDKKKVFKIQDKKELFFCVFAGISLGTVWFIQPAVLFSCLILFVCSLVLYRRAPAEDRRFLLGVFISGTVLRIMFAFLFYQFVVARGHFNFIAPDGETYAQKALEIYETFIDSAYPLSFLPHISEYQIGIYTYFNAFMYVLFGNSPLIMRIFNSFLGVFSALLLYGIGRQIFNNRTARVACAIMAFWPSSFIFSTMNLKDPLINFSILFLIWSLFKFEKNRRVRYVFFILGALALLLFLRIFAFGVAGVFILVYALVKLYSQPIRIRKFLLVFFMVVLFFIPQVKQLGTRGLDSLIHTHFGYATERGAVTNYEIFPKEFYPFGESVKKIGGYVVFSSYLKGLGYALFSPFPWILRSKSEIFAAPQMCVWYFMFAIAVWGAFLGINRNFFGAVVLSVFILGVVSTLALASGNVGTVFRHRDMIAPAFFIFSAFGLTEVFYPKRQTEV